MKHTEVQSVVFFTNRGWNTKNAKAWLDKHGIVPMKAVDKHLHGELRYRLKDPKKYVRFRMMKFKNGIDMVIGILPHKS